MGADEEGTLERLKAHRRQLMDPKITEHRDRIVKMHEPNREIPYSDAEIAGTEADSVLLGRDRLLYRSDGTAPPKRGLWGRARRRQIGDGFGAQRVDADGPRDFLTLCSLRSSNG
jgi:hypothetical protein